MVNESGRNDAANYFIKKVNKQINGFRLQSSLLFCRVATCYLLFFNLTILAFFTPA